jgi:hypothetical protein
MVCFFFTDFNLAVFRWKRRGRSEWLEERDMENRMYFSKE